MLSIVIVNFRTWDHIARNLNSLFASLPAEWGKEWQIEVIVVDNHSDDGRYDAFQRDWPQVRLLSSKGNYGYAHGCNFGAGTARGDWLLFMNPDVICDWQNLAAFWNAAREQSRYAILTAPQYDDNGRLQRSFAPFTTPWTYFPSLRALLRVLMPRRFPDPRTPPEQLSKIIDVDWVTGSLVLISRENFNRLGGWDEDFWLYCEDEDLCRRAHDAGMGVGYFPGAHFVHSHASSTRSSQEVVVLTKSETLLSKYLYLAKHEKNFSGRLLQHWLKVSNAWKRPLWTLIDRLARGKVRKVSIKRGIHDRLNEYFERADATGSLLSDRSIRYGQGNEF